MVLKTEGRRDFLLGDLLINLKQRKGMLMDYILMDLEWNLPYSKVVTKNQIDID